MKEIFNQDDFDKPDLNQEPFVYLEQTALHTEVVFKVHQIFTSTLFETRNQSLQKPRAAKS